MLTSGGTLGRFHLVDVLGRGGMGEVWRATDPRLGRDVAIKVIPSLLSRDAERVLRLQREARALAALNHPHVAQVFELGEQEAAGETGEPEVVHFLVMELVEGEPLDRRLQAGPLPISEVRRLGGQIVSALQAVHQRGVVHRDLKPANVALTPEGNAKLLDFGLARFSRGAGAQPGESDITATLSYPGMAVGTAAYMSPEQVRGKGCDERGDVWALGCCLAEMLSGTGVFARPTIPDTLAAILSGDVDLSLLPSRTPRELRDLVAACLTQDPDQRPGLDQVGAVLAGSGTVFPVSFGDVRRRRGLVGIAAAGLIGLAVLATWMIAGRNVPGPQRRDPFRVALEPIRSVDPIHSARGLDERVTAALLAAVSEKPDLGVRVGEAGTVRVVGSLAPRGGSVALSLTVLDGEDGAVLSHFDGTVAEDGALLGSPSAADHLVGVLEYEKLVHTLAGSDPLHGYLARRTRSLGAVRAFSEGVGHYTRTRWGPAREGLERALAEDQSFWPAHMYLGLVASSQGRFSEKHRHLELVQRVLENPTPAERAVMEAMVALLEEDNQRALESLERSRRFFPGSGELLHRTAQAYRRQDRPEEAIPLLQELLAREWQPDWSPTREELVHNLLLAGRTRRAIRAAREGERRFPQRFRYPLFEAFAHRMRGRDAAAREALDRAIRKRTDFSRSDPLTTRSLTSYWAGLIGWQEERIHQYRRLHDEAVQRLAESPDDSRAQVALAESLLALGGPEEARRVLARLAAPGDDPNACLAMARALHALGEAPEARSMVQCAERVWREEGGTALGTLAYNIACAWVVLGDHETGMNWLLRSRDQYGLDRLDLMLDPELEPLRRQGLLEDLSRRR